MVAVAAPSAPSWNVLVTDWSLDVAFPFVVAAAALYVIGVRRLHARGRPWPGGRTAAFLSGLAGGLVATQSGGGAHHRVLFWPPRGPATPLRAVAPRVRCR